MKSGNYTTRPLGFHRRLIGASVSATTRKSAIHSMTEVDISRPRTLIKAHFERTGEKLSFTGYIVACFAQVINQYPQCNAFIRRNRLVLLNDVNVSVKYIGKYTRNVHEKYTTNI